MKRRIRRLLATLALIPFAFACMPAERAGIPVLSQVDSIGIATAHVLGWCNEHGIDADTAARATKAIHEQDYKTAVPILAQVVDASIKAGDIPDKDVQAFIRLAEQIVAVEAMQDAMRAVSR